jgi:hypothetical protein
MSELSDSTRKDVSDSLTQFRLTYALAVPFIQLLPGVCETQKHQFNCIVWTAEVTNREVDAL